MSTSPENLSQEDHVDATDGVCPDIYATDILVSREGTSFTVNTPAGSRKINIPLLGRHQVYAALAAIAVGLARGVDAGHHRGPPGRDAAGAGPAQSAARPPRQPAPGRLVQRQPGRGRSRAGDVGRAGRPPPYRRAGRHARAGRLRNDGTRTGGQAGGPCPRPPRDQGKSRPQHRRRGARRRHAGRPGHRDLYPRGCGARRAGAAGAGRRSAGQGLACHPHGAGRPAADGRAAPGPRPARPAGRGVAADRDDLAGSTHLAGG